MITYVMILFPALLELFKLRRIGCRSRTVVSTSWYADRQEAPRDTRHPVAELEFWSVNR